MASLGLTEAQAREQGYDLDIGQFPFQANGKALGLGEREGFIKIISDAKYGEILGVHMVGPEVTELLPELSLAEHDGTDPDRDRPQCPCPSHPLGSDHGSCTCRHGPRHSQLTLMNATPVILYGLGPIGIGIGRALTEDTRFEIAGAVDRDPAIIGRMIYEVCDANLPPVTVVSSLAETGAKAGAVVLQATVSKLEAARPQLLDAFARGYHVVSTCGEMAWPWDDNLQLAHEIDQAARKASVTAIGVGVNPGFMMDTLPVLLSRAASEVEAIYVSRIVDLAERRLPLQRKNGLGQTVERVQKMLDQEAIGHVGLATSVQMLAAGLGWNIDVIDIDSRAIPAKAFTSTEYFDIPAGGCVGIRQRVRGYVRGAPRIVFDLIIEANAEGGSHDEILIDGDQSLRMRLDGLHGDSATSALIVNEALQVQNMPPGLQTMLSAPLVSRL